MPLIFITTPAQLCPAAKPEEDTPDQAITARFGESLPAIFVLHAPALGLDRDTPDEGVQVDYGSFHPRVVNGVDFSVLVQFTETPPSDENQVAIKERLKNLMLSWFVDNGVDIDEQDIALDVFWGPGRGFLRLGITQTFVDW